MNQTSTTNILGLDPTNPMSYVLVAGIILGICLIAYLIVLTSDSNKELTKIRELLEKQSSTGDPTPSGGEPQTPLTEAKTPEWKPINKEGGEL